MIALSFNHSAAITAVVLVVAFIAAPFLAQARVRARSRRRRLEDWRDRVQLHYCGLGPNAFSFAWCKLRMDSMFADLPQWLTKDSSAQSLLDLGCGIGVAGCWALEQAPRLRIFGIDPARGRIGIASKAFGDRGIAAVAAAPDFDAPGMPDHFDIALCLDVIHHLSDADLQTSFNRLHRRLLPGGKFILRTIIPPAGGGSALWKLDCVRRFLIREKAYHRSVEAIGAALERSGFAIETVQPTSSNPEMFWFIAVAAR